jgi:hypothetical protein
MPNNSHFGFKACFCASQGGGIWTDGTLKIVGGTLGSNDATSGNGGGMFQQGGTATVSGCSIASNMAANPENSHELLRI